MVQCQDSIVFLVTRCIITQKNKSQQLSFLHKMSSCKGVDDTAFYSMERKNLFVETTSDKISKKTGDADCWFPSANLDDEQCPSGWKYVRDTTQGCSGQRIRAVCKYDNYPTDDKTLALCCLGAHKPSKMSDTGQFTTKPCPHGLCPSSQNSQQCRNAVRNYCRTQFAVGQPHHDLCWQYAKDHWPDGADKFCRDVGQGNGWGVVNNKDCKDYVESDEARGKMDDSVSALCTSKRGKNLPLCSCFPAAVDLTDAAKKFNDLGAPLSCWSDRCMTEGYQTKDMLERAKSGCGVFCASALDIADTAVDGDFNSIVNLTCDGKQRSDTVKEKAKEALVEVEKTKSEPTTQETVDNASKNQTLKIIFIAVGAVLLLLLLAFAVSQLVGSSSDTQMANFNMSGFNSFAAPSYQFEPPQIVQL